MRKTACLFVVVLLAVSAIPLAALAGTRGFDTPEDCAKALVEALKTQNISAMEACVAFDELAESYNFRAQAERMKAILPNMMMPAHDAFAIEYNRAMLKSNWYKKLESFNLGALSPALKTTFVELRPVSEKAEEYTQILNDLDTLAGFNVFALMQYEGILMPADFSEISEAYASERAQELLQRELAVWGTDTCVEFAIEVSAAGVGFAIPLRFYQFDGRWLASPGSSMLSSLLMMNTNEFFCEVPN